MPQFTFEQAFQLGITLQAQGRLDDAIAAYRQAIALNGDSPHAHSNLGVTLKEKGKPEQAVAAYRQALAGKPGWAAALVNLGNALMTIEQLDDAVTAYRQAIAGSPDLPEAHYNLGNALRDQGRLDEAIASYRRTIALKPNWPQAHSNLVFSLHYAHDDGPAILREHQEWARRHADGMAARLQPHGNDPSPERRLRVGYVSPDFREHVVARQMLDLLPRHDRAQVEIFCYANVAVEDKFSQRLRAAADHWRNIAGVDDAAAAATIRADGIDILVDLAVHSANNRLLIFAVRPAPVQVTHMGYPATTGLSAIDYRLTDAVLDPPATGDDANSEKLLRLPHGYYCFTRPPHPEPGPPPVARNGFITFACLNNLAKITGGVVELWCRILQEIGESRLLLPSANGPDGNARLLERFARHGVDTGRISLTTERGPAYTALYHGIDIALDPFPFGGANITFDALWMGVPVITLRGKTSVGRAAASILTAIDMQELIAPTPSDYVQIATTLARDPQRLAQLRHDLRPRLQHSPLSDPAAYTRDLESAYRHMWRQWCVTRANGR